MCKKCEHVETYTNVPPKTKKKYYNTIYHYVKS